MIAENRLCDLQVFSNLSNYNYRIFVNEMLLEIGFIEICFISSNWPATNQYRRSQRGGPGGPPPQIGPRLARGPARPPLI